MRLHILRPEDMHMDRMDQVAGVDQVVTVATADDSAQKQRLLQINITILKAFFLLGVFLTVVYLYINSIDNKIFYPVVRLGHSHKPPPGQNVSRAVLSYSCKQNKSVESIENFSLFNKNVKDFLYYRHCRHFPMLLDLPDKCGGANRSSDVFLLLAIKTHPENYDRREILRKTWADEREVNGVWIRRVFITGTMGSRFEKESLNTVLGMEQSKYKDILQWDFTDTHQNLTLKQMLFFEWIGRSCPKARFLFDGDDDVFVNINNVVKYLQSLEDNDGSKHLYTGNYVVDMPPIRTLWSKYCVPVQMYKPEVYLPYCSGGGFLLTSYTASVIYNMSQSIPLLPVDDAYIGMCLAKAGVSPVGHAGVRTFGVHIPSQRVNDYDPCFYKELLVVHRFISAKMYYMWDRINDPNLKCFGNFK